MGEIDGHTIIARSLKEQGVESMYGVVGIPVAGIAGAAQREGIRYVGMRHEMPATYAAQAASYLTGHIGTALAVSGPGVLNAVGAFANAWSNRWPMLLLGGSYESTGGSMGYFQEADQLSALRPYAKYAERVESMERIPIYIAEAIKKAIHGAPGPSYLDLPGDFIMGKTDEDKVEWAHRVADPPRTVVAPEDAQAAIDALKTAEQPLIIIGKGAAWSPRRRGSPRLRREDGHPLPPHADGQGRRPGRPRPVGGGGALVRAQQRRPDRAHRRATELDAPLRSAAALPQGRAHHPARQEPGGDRRQRPGRGCPRRRRQGRRRPDARHPRRRAVAGSRRTRNGCRRSRRRPGRTRSWSKG